jgi:dihydrofolate reductase
MGKVIWDMSMSLDGFITASNRRPEEPMGDGGERLHEWFFAEDERDREILARAGESLGALIAGRRTCDDSVRFWGADGPTGAARFPLFVVTHEAPKESPEGGVYAFVTDGIEGALERAKAAAGGRDVAVMGGADVGRQLVRAGPVDEIGVHLVPVLFGSDLRMFGHLGDEHVELETVELIDTAAATHLRFRIVR